MQLCLLTLSFRSSIVNGAINPNLCQNITTRSIISTGIKIKEASGLDKNPKNIIEIDDNWFDLKLKIDDEKI